MNMLAQEVVMSTVPLYDAFSEDYDRFVNWEARLAFELPFFRSVFERYAVKRLLDVACGTGQHAIALAREGYEVTATDLSAAMVERAQANAAAAGVRLHIHRLGFGELAGALEGLYDAIICLGNSLPHITDAIALREALEDFTHVLKPGGIVVIQNRNFDRVLARQERFMPPEVHRTGEQEWVFMRFYDFCGEQLRFNVARLHRQGDEEWKVQLEHTQLRAWHTETLYRLLNDAGLDLVSALGSYRSEVFDPLASSDLVLLARRPQPPSRANS
jgi:glycine/sarcosine N-methyltransferase